jgi:signal transduction histidine kinase/FixJ family two-component response regulator
VATEAPRETNAADPPSAVLIVDDEPAARYAVGRWLERAGFAVDSVDSGESAIDRATRGTDLIILDVNLPDLHGFDVVRRLKQNPRTAHIPVLHLSAVRVSAADRAEGLDAGADGYLTHPFEPAELVATATALLRLKRTEHELRQQLARGAVLHDISTALSGTRTLDDVGGAVLGHLVRSIGAETGFMALLSEDGSELHLHGAVTAEDAVADDWTSMLSALRAPSVAAVANDRAVSSWTIDEIRDEFPAMAQALERMNAQALWCVQLTSANRALGVIDLCFADAHHPADHDVALLTVIAAQCAVALDRVLSAESERNARRRAERLQRLTEELSNARTLEEVAEAAVVHATGALGAIGAVIALIEPDGATLEIVRSLDLADDALDSWRRFPLSSPVPLAEATRTTTPIFLHSLDDWQRRYPDLFQLAQAAEHHANAVVPLVVNGSAIGAIGIAFDAPRAFPEDERLAAFSAARQCAQAFERVRLFAAEHSARAFAESASRAKSDFLAVMSHELRTPLNAIGGYAELIELGIRGPVTPEQLQDLRRIQVAQRHLAGLVNDVLNYVRIETGRVQYQLADLVLDDLLVGLDALIAPQVATKQLRYEYKPSDPAFVVRADREKVAQILLNLLTNAVKFTPSGGHITLECVAEAHRIHVCVRDDGIGIPPDKIEAIFDPFVQVSQRLVRESEGVGLGLAISRDLARGMAGSLNVESELGVGSTFTLSLPRAK